MSYEGPENIVRGSEIVGFRRGSEKYCRCLINVVVVHKYVVGV